MHKMFANFKLSMGKWIILFAVIAFIVILMLGNPSSSAWWLKCPLYLFTGWQCPFCGLQRQLHALLHFHFVEAWQLNPVLLLCYPYLFLLFLSALCPNILNVSRQHPHIHRFLSVCLSDRTLLIFAIIMLVWGIARNC